MTLRPFIGAALLLSVLAACGEEQIILPGERFDIRDSVAVVNQSLPLALPQARINADWTQSAARPAHPAIGADLQPAFVAQIGAGDSRRARITGAPVVAGGVVYTVDAGATVTATTTSGQTLWQRDLTPARFNAGEASGGAVSFGGGRVYVTTGFGEITALDPATGGTLWTKNLNAPVNAPASFNGELVYVVARDSTAWALDAATGLTRWQQSGTPSLTAFAGSAPVAVSGDIVVIPFSSGEILATYPQGGLPRWTNVVAGDRLGRAVTLVSDIAGAPVIDAGRVYAASFGGRSVAFDLRDGSRIWTAGEGAVGQIWPAGGSVFMVNDISELVRLDAASGAPVWRVALPGLASDNSRRQRSVIAHFGPVLAGGRLIVASSDGLIRQFDPVSGALIGTIALPGGAASAPVVAGQTLYVITQTGQLHAFR
ncbi:PQQ-like beta-propeller repeat protein [Yoonia vestfoldensis]|uniref:Outer membrane protein assembly factor BamB n=1 Tax=Yoonia vestfoldensis TaxID=245188 RepID=A0A1Y0ECF2_9RHOB|nr:PQQ-like beta-propeller repeat protein [Yoonia vestfoldensis]ARU01069.1 outer membrane protein assembly factor BamB [Yoonia vestfoldensis]